MQLWGKRDKYGERERIYVGTESASGKRIKTAACLFYVHFITAYPSCSQYSYIHYYYYCYYCVSAEYDFGPQG